jgi:myosin-5
MLQTACIHTPRAAHGRSTASALPRRSASGDGTAAASQSAAAAAQNKAWTDILAVFDQLLTTLKDNQVPQPLVRALFKQLFSFVNVQLFNQLLLRRECCSFSNGEYVKTGLALVSVLGRGQ